MTVISLINLQVLKLNKTKSQVSAEPVFIGLRRDLNRLNDIPVFKVLTGLLCGVRCACSSARSNLDFLIRAVEVSPKMLFYSWPWNQLPGCTV